MGFVSTVLLSCCLIVSRVNAGGSGSGNRVSVIQKVIEMLEENRVKVIKDLDREMKDMEEYADFCDDESSEKGYAIKTAVSQIQDMTGTIEDNDANIKVAENEIEEVGTTMALKDRELAEAKQLREEEAADFDSTEKELVAAIESIEAGILTLKKQEEVVASAMANMGGGAASAALVQTAGKNQMRLHAPDMKVLERAYSLIVNTAWADPTSVKAVKNLLQTQTQEDSDLEVKQKEPEDDEKVETEGDGTIETFEELKTKAETKLSDARTDETNRKHNFDMLHQSIVQAQNIEKQKLADANGERSKLMEENGNLKGRLAEVQGGKAKDEKFLDTVRTECVTAARDWELRQRSAKQEMAALQKAKEILSERVKESTNLVQTRVRDPDQAPSAEQKTQRVVRARLVKNLQLLGFKFKSYALLDLLSAAASDPFEKIKEMISQMISKMQAEAAEESTQKQFCDEELAKTNDDKQKKNMRLDKLKSRLDTTSSKSEDMQENVKNLEREIAATDQGVAEATKIRNEEHATYLVASADYKNAAEAVQEAISTLQDYYEGAAGLVQVSIASKLASNSVRQAPEMGEAKSDTANQIISILEMSGTEFNQMYTEVEASEKHQVQDFQKLLHEAKVTRATKGTEAKNGLSQMNSFKVNLKHGKEDYKMVASELDAILAYQEKLRPQCQTKVMSYGEKKARREAEIVGLKEALSILDENTALIQGVTKSFLRAGH